MKEQLQTSKHPLLPMILQRWPWTGFPGTEGFILRLTDEETFPADQLELTEYLNRSLEDITGESFHTIDVTDTVDGYRKLTYRLADGTPVTLQILYTPRRRYVVASRPTPLGQLQLIGLSLGSDFIDTWVLYMAAARETYTVQE